MNLCKRKEHTHWSDFFSWGGDIPHHAGHLTCNAHGHKWCVICKYAFPAQPILDYNSLNGEQFCSRCLHYVDHHLNNANHCKCNPQTQPEKLA